MSSSSATSIRIPVGVPANSGSPWVTITVLSALIASQASIVFRFGQEVTRRRAD